ncbi:hypothetical protein [Actinoplanes regularis]|uniref:hypothetical protein n=1 Tax=Actinoplanes regularis TaxID=52697 RepID=UPI0024A1FDAC|nr:hypothetical protein [Actinoplanes regularis]GLW32223.1 hypothetical protein Areg01_51620 [Actinoplanes regularis]
MTWGRILLAAVSVAAVAGLGASTPTEDAGSNAVALCKQYEAGVGQDLDCDDVAHFPVTNCSQIGALFSELDRRRHFDGLSAVNCSAG